MRAVGITLASPGMVPKTPIKLGYDEPTVMWRMHRTDGQRSHAVITPGPRGAVFVWFLNDCPLGQRDFADLRDAVRWSEQMQFQNWAVGWRLSD